MPDSWEEWGLYIKKELERLNESINVLTHHVNDQNEVLHDRIMKLELEGAREEPKWELLKWLVASVGGALIAFLFAKLSNLV